MAVGQFQIQGLVQGSPNPQLVLPPYYLPSPTSIPEVIPVTLAASANTITIPHPSTNGMVLIVPPNYAWPTALSTFSGTLTLKGVSGDTGILISNTYPTEFALAATSPSSFVITATTTGTMTVIVA